MTLPSSGAASWAVALSSGADTDEAFHKDFLGVRRWEPDFVTGISQRMATGYDRISGHRPTCRSLFPWTAFHESNFIGRRQRVASRTLLRDLHTALTSQQINDFDCVSIVLQEGVEREAHRFTVCDFVPISDDTVDGLAKLPIRILFELQLPLLTEAASQSQNRPHLWILKLPQATLTKLSNRRVSPLACVFSVRDPNGILQEPTN